MCETTGGIYCRIPRDTSPDHAHATNSVPVTASPTQVIVYDEHQAIYGWRGARAVGAIVQLSAVARCRLSQTWRYGAPLSTAAAAVVRHIKGLAPSEFTITGKPNHITQIVVADKPCVGAGRLVVLARFNATLFDTAVGLLQCAPVLIRA